MKTVLSQFCEDFDAALRPLLGPLQEFVETLSAGVGAGATGHAAGHAVGVARVAAAGRGGAAGQGTEGAAGVEVRAVLPAFQDVSHQLRVLADKVAEQQAYVLIFGPLKSGKSTLMNAIGAAYVSEVTALPAYPCMVYVSHAPTREFQVTRYNGDRQSFAAPASMRMQVNRDHAELADRIRSEERRGVDFDPAVHFPEAIRRIDVKVPAEALGESGAVLVDTPGLYSRMKFGYDQMTREFRDAAACAIFVVKTDNLFLEQVFAEFEALLGLFSRIFLVVNVDTGKLDLRPDGSLAPSLEREDPVRVIEAFESLSMSAPLKRAVDDGRLRIYPVDLLRAASSRLQQTQAREGAGGGEYTGRADFEAFLSDLTDYLNSNDYLVAFLGDSLRHGRVLLARVDQLTRDQGVEALARRAAALAEEKDRLELRLADLSLLHGYDWTEAFGGLGAALVADNQAEAQRLWKRALKSVSHTIDGWFEGDESLAQLLNDGVAEALRGFQLEYATLLEQSLRRRAAGNTAGGLVPEKVACAVDRVDLRLADFASSGLIAIEPKLSGRKIELELDTSFVPVRRGLLDWLLLRRVATVRRRLLGPHHERAIPRREKAARLGERGREWLHDEIHARVDNRLQEVTEQIAHRLASDYTGAIDAALRNQLGRLRTGDDERLEGLCAELGDLEQLSDQLELLRGRVGGARQVLDDLALRYEEADAASLEQVVLPRGEGPGPARLERERSAELRPRPFPSP
jgi:hypothetical protein